MYDDFLALRARVSSLPHQTVQPRPHSAAIAGKCWHNTKMAVDLFGGSMQYGWAIANLGPVPVSGCKLPSLYSRWVNHIVWRDTEHVLWEVTPHTDVVHSGHSWRPTVFVADDAAQFEFASQEGCCPLPAIYIAVRPEGEWTADCLCQAERAPLNVQDQWLNRALLSTHFAGFSPVKWEVRRMYDKISDAWLFA
jgi:hypothetical protein